MKVSKTLTEAFEGFWAAYPRRPDNPKAAARLVFERRVREGADPAEVAAAAGRYAAFCEATKLDAPFIPHARTWLSQRRYEDYPAEAPASAPAPAAPPSPEHPLAWLRAEISEAAWVSWIAQLQIDEAARPVAITGPNGFVLNHVRREWGYLLQRRYGADLVWALAPKERP